MNFQYGKKCFTKGLTSNPYSLLSNPVLIYCGINLDKTVINYRLSTINIYISSELNIVGTDFLVHKPTLINLTDAKPYFLDFSEYSGTSTRNMLYSALKCTIKNQHPILGSTVPWATNIPKDHTIKINKYYDLTNELIKNSYVFNFYAVEVGAKSIPAKSLQPAKRFRLVKNFNTMSERPQPLKAINRLLEGREPWQIVTMTASSVLALVWAHNLYNGRESVSTRLRKEFFRWLRQVPIVRRKIEEKMSEINSDFRKDVRKRLSGVTIRRTLPEKGLTAEQVAEEVKDHLSLGTVDWKAGNVSGAVYHLSEEISRVACDAYSLTAYTNPLHADVFPGINKMEAELVRMAVQLFHGDEDACGTVTTGGTESIIMACKAFRDYAYSRGISNPQIIVPSTVHSAFDKAAQYLGLSVKTIPVDKETLTVDVEAVRSAIGSRTCLIVGSAPNYPYGTMDNIRALSDIAVEYDVPLHVDACLGGFIGAFMSDAGYDIPAFDFRLPGVASISADTHKYGYAPKGTSVILYRKPEYRHCQYTVTTDWPGGVYGSPTVNGSRAGGSIAACWATMMFVGRQRYVEMTREVIDTARFIEREIRNIEGLFVFGKPATTVIGLGSKKFDIFKMAEIMHKKGWSLNALQFPSGVHICVTHAHTQAGVAERFVNDVRESAATCMKVAGSPVEGKMAIYGVAQEISDRSLVSDITKYFIDSMYYLPSPEDD